MIICFDIKKFFILLFKEPVLSSLNLLIIIFILIPFIITFINRVIPKDTISNSGKGMMKYIANAKIVYVVSHLEYILKKKELSLLLLSPFCILIPFFTLKMNLFVNILSANLINHLLFFLIN